MKIILLNKKYKNIKKDPREKRERDEKNYL